MKGKLAVLAGLGAGYVLGTKAGRERYEQIKNGVGRLWQDPRVQQKRRQAAQVAKEQGAVAKEKVQQKVQEKVQEHKQDGSGTGTDSVSASDLPDAPSWQP